MKTPTSEKRLLKRCRCIAAAILLIGTICSGVVFVTASEQVVDPFAEFEKSKKFAYELQRMGGKAALAANDINNWFGGLWHGEALAYTILVITFVVAGCYYFVAAGLAAEKK